jgi:hypothetical protein
VDKKYSCKCGCGLNNFRPEMVTFGLRLHTVLLWYFNDHVEEEILSACRCIDKHKKIYFDIGYKEKDIPLKSYHLEGMAKDSVFLVGGEIILPLEIAYLVQHHSNFLHATEYNGIGAMKDSIHLDMRPHPKTWVRENGKYIYNVDFHKRLLNR